MGKERTLVLIKPDAIEDNLIAQIMTEIDRLNDYKIIGMYMKKIPREMAEDHYEEHRNKPFFKSIVNNLCSSKIVAMALEGADIVTRMRELAGETDPENASAESIRGKFKPENCKNTDERLIKNRVHTSDSPSSAHRELTIWFAEFF